MENNLLQKVGKRMGECLLWKIVHVEGKNNSRMGNGLL